MDCDTFEFNRNLVFSYCLIIGVYHSVVAHDTTLAKRKSQTVPFCLYFTSSKRNFIVLLSNLILSITLSNSSQSCVSYSRDILFFDDQFATRPGSNI